MSRAPQNYFGEPPAGYVGGMGRGAVGFSTRSDIGPAQATIEKLPDTFPFSAGRGRNLSLAHGRSVAQSIAESGSAVYSNPVARTKETEQDLSESVYDKFSGYGGSLFDSSTPYDQEDSNADAVYEAIDNRMDTRRRARRDKREQEELLAFRKKKPKIQEQFADLKQGLQMLSTSDWLSIPEADDYSKSNKRTNMREDKYTPVPDSIVDSSRRSNKIDISLAPVDLRKVGTARDQVLGLKLDKVSDSVSGQTVVDPKGYLTDLNSTRLSSDSEVSDLKKARLLLQSVVESNPGHAPGWIAAARLEETAGKASAARSLIMRGVAKCPNSEDVWLEAARLHDNESSKRVLAQAVGCIPTSVNLWLAAADLENLQSKRKIVLRKALEAIPISVALWKAAINLEDSDGARTLLRKAVICVPAATELWIALARLEPYPVAKKVLNRAGKANPKDPSVWITGAQLEESQGNTEMVETIIRKAIRNLAKKRVVIDRYQWMCEAQAAEAAGTPMTCKAIIRTTLGIGVNDADRKHRWKADAEKMVSEGSIETARAIYSQMLNEYPTEESFWEAATILEKKYGSNDHLEAILLRSVVACPRAEDLWLLCANESWNMGSLDSARRILSDAFAANPNSEKIWLAAMKLEWESGEHSNAREILSTARRTASTARIWMKSALLEREVGDFSAEEQILRAGLVQHPECFKMWAMLSENRIRCGDNLSALEVLDEGLSSCSSADLLWVLRSRIEETIPGKRAVLEQARRRNDSSDWIWLESVKLELLPGGSQSAATYLLSRALQACPTSGRLWALAVEIQPKAKQKSISVDALKHCSDDPHVCISLAKILWADRRDVEVKKWLERAISADRDLGDAWAYYYRFMCLCGTKVDQDKVISACIVAEPKHGQLWCNVSKAPGAWSLTTTSILLRVSETISDFPSNL